MRKLFLPMLVFVIASCGNMNQKELQNENILSGEYQLTDVQGKDLTSETLFMTFTPEDYRVAGDTGCNGFSSEYTQDGETVIFSAPVSTRKYCEGKMETEQEIHTALEKVTKFQRKGNEFVFYSKENTPLFSLTKIEESE